MNHGCCERHPPLLTAATILDHPKEILLKFNFLFYWSIDEVIQPIIGG